MKKRNNSISPSMNRIGEMIAKRVGRNQSNKNPPKFTITTSGKKRVPDKQFLKEKKPS